MQKLLSTFFLAGVFMAVIFGQDKEGFTVSSSSFQNSKAIPAKLAMKAVEGGQNQSPELSWKNAPQGTKAFAITCIDIHPIAQKWVHWIAIDIPAETLNLPEGASPSKMPKGAIELKNSFGGKGYGGPQPPKGSGVHNYIFTVYALSEPVKADGFLSEDAFLKLVSGKVLAKTEITGTFSR